MNAIVWSDTRTGDIAKNLIKKNGDNPYCF
jgi:hypothetical protein